MKIHEALDTNQIWLLDGAMGTELERRGVPLPEPLWSAVALFSHPDVVEQIHYEYLKAGANFITTCTFRTSEYTFQNPKSREILAQLGFPDATYEDAIKRAVNLARRAIERAQPKQPVFLLGGIGPMEDCFHPEKAPEVDVAYALHKKTARALMDEKVDALLFETLGAFQEFWAVLYLQYHYFPFSMFSLMLKDSQSMLDGKNLVEAFSSLTPFSPLALCFNCTPPEIIADALYQLPPDILRGYIFGVYPNCGFSLERSAPCDIPPEVFADTMEMLFYKRNYPAKRQVRIYGGCCGTSPEHIDRLRQKISRWSL
ncbi:MAG: homocysteine S-methyltransferase family protein [bacterium JZ-2024 1]